MQTKESKETMGRESYDACVKHLQSLTRQELERVALFMWMGGVRTDPGEYAKAYFLKQNPTVHISMPPWHQPLDIKIHHEDGTDYITSDEMDRVFAKMCRVTTPPAQT